MESDVNIKEGYKKTAMGVIPEDWEVKKLISQVFVDKENINSSFNEKHIKYVSLSDIDNGKIYPNIIEYENAPSRAKRIAEKGSVLLATVRPNLKNFAMVDENNIIASTGFAVLSKKKMNMLYLYNFLYSDIAAKQYYSLTVGSNYPALNSDDVKNLILLIPPLPEQKTIANCLTTWDSGIEKLSALIKAKKELKKGLMQQLLSGEKRLDGFEGEWKEVKLGELCSMSTGKLNANAMVDKGLYRFYTCAKEHFYINHYAFDTEALLISGNGANVGYIHYYKGKFNAYQRTYVLDKFNQSILYIKYYLDEKLEHRILKEKNEGNTPYIVLSTLQQMKIILPSLSEQTAIAEVLTTADKEITLLKKKLERFKEQKRGLMQVLLTGERRLIENC